MPQSGSEKFGVVVVVCLLRIYHLSRYINVSIFAGLMVSNLVSRDCYFYLVQQGSQTGNLLHFFHLHYSLIGIFWAVTLPIDCIQINI